MPNRSIKKALMTAAAVGVLALSQRVQADTASWAVDASGDWLSSNWSINGASPTLFANGDDAVINRPAFGAYTITVNNSWILNSLNDVDEIVNDHNGGLYLSSGTSSTIGINAQLLLSAPLQLYSGSTASLTNYGTIAVTALNNNYTFGSGIALTNYMTMTVNSPGSLNSNFTGASFDNEALLDIQDGSFTINPSGSAVSNGAINVESGTYLYVNNTTINGSVVGSGTFAFAGGKNTVNSNWSFGGQTINAPGSTTTFNYPVSSLITVGGTVNFNSTLASVAVINNGTANFFGDLSTGAVNLGPNGTANVFPSSGATSGNTLLKGSYYVPAASTLNFMQPITTNAATVTLDGATSSVPAFANLTTNTGALGLGDGRDFTFVPIGGVFTNSGTLTKAYTGSATIPASVTLNNTGTVIVNGGVLNVSGPITQLTGPNNAATLAGGTWKVSGSTATLNFTGVSIVNNAATLVLMSTSANPFPALNSLANNTGMISLSNGAAFTTAGAFNNSGQILVGPSSTFTVSGPLTMGDGTFQLGPGTSTFSELVLRGDVTFSPVTGTSGITSATVGDAENIGLVDMGGGTRTFTTNPGLMAVSAVISAQLFDGTFVKAGTGTLQLAQPAAYLGTTTVSAGTLQAGRSYVLPPSTDLTVAAGATLDLNGFDNQIGSLGGAGSVTLGGAALTLATNNNKTFSGSISGAGSVNMSGTGTQTLSGSNSWTGGGLNVSDGTVVLSGSNTFTGGIGALGGTVVAGTDTALGDPSNTVTIGYGGGLDATASFSTARTFIASFKTTGYMTVEPGVTLTLTGGGLTGLGGVNKYGTGVLQSNVSNSMTGGLLVSAGTFRLAGPAGAMPATSGVTIATGGTFEMNSSTALGGNHLTQNRLNDAASIALYGGTLSLIGADGTSTTETVGGVSAVLGASTISVTPGGSGGTVNLILSSFAQTGSAASVNFVIPGSIGTTAAVHISTGYADGAHLGAFATITYAGGTDLAKYSTANGVVPFAASDYTTNQLTPANNGQNIRFTSITPITYTPSSVAPATLNFDTSYTTTINQVAGTTLNVTAGTIIKTGASTTTIAKGILTTNAATLQLDTGAGVLEVSSQLSGAFSVSQQGAGAVLLDNTAAASFGNYTLNSGQLNLNATATAISGNLLVNSGMVMSMKSSQLTTLSAVTLAGGTWDLNGQSESIASLTNTGGTMLFHGGVVVSSGPVTWSGGTTIIASTLTAQSAINVSGGANDVNADGVVTVPLLNFTGGNSPSVVVAADASTPGKLVLTNSMSFSGTGTAMISSTAVNGQQLGILNLNSGVRGVNVGAGAVLQVSTTVTAGGLDVSGTGTLELVNPNSFTMGTIIEQSTTVQADDPASLGNSGSSVKFAGGTLALRNDNGGTYPYALTASTSSSSMNIDIDRLHPGATAGTFIVSSLSLGSGNAAFTLTGSEGGTFQTNSLGLQVNGTTSGPAYLHLGANFVVNGNIFDSTYPVDIYKDGVGTLTLGGTAVNGYGNYTVAGGTLVLNKPANVVAISGNLTVMNGSTVRLMASGQISNIATVTLNDTSVLDLNGNNETFASGALNFVAGGSLTTGAGTATLSGTVAFSGTTGGANISGNVAFGLSSTTFAIARGNKGADMTISAAISGGTTQIPIAITKSGTGILYLSGANTFVGTIAVTGGAIQVDGDTNLGNAANVITLNGGTLLSKGTITHTVMLAGIGGTADVESTNVTTMNAVINGSGGLSKVGTGTLILGSSDPFTGGVAINGGTVQVSSDLYLGTGGGAISFSGGTLTAAGTLVNGRPITLNASGTINATSAVTLNGGISGAGNLIKTGTAGLTLSGANTFTGGLNINQGTVTVSSDGNQGGTGGGVILNGGTLATGGAFTDTHPLAVWSGGGSLNAASGELTLSTPLTWEGNITLTGGTLDFNAATGTAFAQGTPTLTINAGATVIDDGAVDPLAGGMVNVVNNSVTSFNVVSGYKTAGVVSGTGNTNISAGTNLAATAIRQNTLTVNGTATINIASPHNAAATISVLNTLVLAGQTNAWAGRFDLGNSDLDIRAGVLSTVTNQLRQGYNFGAGSIWLASGGITSVAAAANFSHNTALGVIQNNQGGSPVYGNGVGLGAFDETFPGSTDILVKYTYYGDANLDGKVDGSDYALIDNGYNKRLTGWYNGDFNYDGVVDGSDYTLIDNAFNSQTQNFSTNALVADSTAQIADVGGDASAVPEPAFLGLFGLFGLLGLQRRR